MTVLSELVIREASHRYLTLEAHRTIVDLTVPVVLERLRPSQRTDDITAAVTLAASIALTINDTPPDGDESEVVAFLDGECPAGGPHHFAEHNESPRGPSRVVHCTECDAAP